MANPQAELFKMLAESNIRHQEITGIHGRSLSTIPTRQDALLQEIQQLREHIEAVGIGTDPKSEDRYLKALEQQRGLHQSYAMGKRAEPEEEKPAQDADLLKALDWGELLLSIYGGGVLMKAGGGDVEAAARRLDGKGAIADELAGKLRAIALS